MDSEISFRSNRGKVGEGWALKIESFLGPVGSST
jgi:hypothetical protein